MTRILLFFWTGRSLQPPESGAIRNLSFFFFFCSRKAKAGGGVGAGWCCAARAAATQTRVTCAVPTRFSRFPFLFPGGYPAAHPSTVRRTGTRR